MRTFETDIENETDEKSALLFLIGHDTANELGELTHEMRGQCGFDIPQERVQTLIDELVAADKLVRYLPSNPGEPIQYSTKYTPANY